MVNLTIKEFLGELSTDAPVPGGGGASALAGAICSALCSMVASLTTGKKKYAQYQQDIERILKETRTRTHLSRFPGHMAFQRKIRSVKKSWKRRCERLVVHRWTFYAKHVK